MKFITIMFISIALFTTNTFSKDLSMKKKNTGILKLKSGFSSKCIFTQEGLDMKSKRKTNSKNEYIVEATMLFDDQWMKFKNISNFSLTGRIKYGDLNTSYSNNFDPELKLMFEQMIKTLSDNKKLLENTLYGNSFDLGKEITFDIDASDLILNLSVGFGMDKNEAEIFYNNLLYESSAIFSGSLMLNNSEARVIKLISGFKVLDAELKKNLGEDFENKDASNIIYHDDSGFIFQPNDGNCQIFKKGNKVEEFNTSDFINLN